MVNQVMLTLSECEDAYLKANMGWIMPSLCELIRSNDEEVIGQGCSHFALDKRMFLPFFLSFLSFLTGANKSP
jgi:hypothetical protein